MEGLPQSTKNEQKYPIENIGLFGQTLSKARQKIGNPSRSEIAKICKVNFKSVGAWEKGEAFPTNENLPLVAKAYDINYETLKIIFSVSKNAKETEKDARKGKSSGQGKSQEQMFSGDISRQGKKSHYASRARHFGSS